MCGGESIILLTYLFSADRSSLRTSTSLPESLSTEALQPLMLLLSMQVFNYYEEGMGLGFDFLVTVISVNHR